MIRTFIFLDLETTGLITRNLIPKVTELSLIAVSRNAIIKTTEALPRVLHKLILPVQPGRHISKEIQKLTDLSNEDLEEVQSFNNVTYTLLIDFMQRLTGPTCFVAYNGNSFDYPLLLWELKSINKSFRKEILSIDMLHLIKEFFSNKTNPAKGANDAQVTTSAVCSNKEVSILMNDGFDQSLSEALDDYMATNLNINDKNESSNAQQTCWYKKMQEINEKTPERKIEKSLRSKKTIQRRKLNFTNNQPTNFKLSNVCKHICGTDPEHAHTAEGDCLSMLRCAVQLGNYFVEWADCNAVPLVSYDKL